MNPFVGDFKGLIQRTAKGLDEVDSMRAALPNQGLPVLYSLLEEWAEQREAFPRRRDLSSEEVALLLECDTVIGDLIDKADRVKNNVFWAEATADVEIQQLEDLMEVMSLTQGRVRTLDEEMATMLDKKLTPMRRSGIEARVYDCSHPGGIAYLTLEYLLSMSSQADRHLYRFHKCSELMDQQSTPFSGRSDPRFEIQALTAQYEGGQKEYLTGILTIESMKLRDAIMVFARKLNEAWNLDVPLPGEEMEVEAALAPEFTRSAKAKKLVEHAREGLEILERAWNSSSSDLLSPAQRRLQHIPTDALALRELLAAGGLVLGEREAPAILQLLAGHLAGNLNLHDVENLRTKMWADNLMFVGGVAKALRRYDLSHMQIERLIALRDLLDETFPEPSACLEIRHTLTYFKELLSSTVQHKIETEMLDEFMHQLRRFEKAGRAESRQVDVTVSVGRGLQVQLGLSVGSSVSTGDTSSIVVQKVVSAPAGVRAEMSKLSRVDLSVSLEAVKGQRFPNVEELARYLASSVSETILAGPGAQRRKAVKRKKIARASAMHERRAPATAATLMGILQRRMPTVVTGADVIQPFRSNLHSRSVKTRGFKATAAVELSADAVGLVAGASVADISQTASRRVPLSQYFENHPEHLALHPLPLEFVNEEEVAKMNASEVDAALQKMQLEWARYCRRSFDLEMYADRIERGVPIGFNAQFIRIAELKTSLQSMKSLLASPGIPSEEKARLKKDIKVREAEIEECQQDIASAKKLQRLQAQAAMDEIRVIQRQHGLSDKRAVPVTYQLKMQDLWEKLEARYAELHRANQQVEPEKTRFPIDWKPSLADLFEGSLLQGSAIAVREDLSKQLSKARAELREIDELEVDEEDSRREKYIKKIGALFDQVERVEALRKLMQKRVLERMEQLKQESTLYQQLVNRLDADRRDYQALKSRVPLKGKSISAEMKKRKRELHAEIADLRNQKKAIEKRRGDVAGRAHFLRDCAVEQALLKNLYRDCSTEEEYREFRDSAQVGEADRFHDKPTVQLNERDEEILTAEEKHPVAGREYTITSELAVPGAPPMSLSVSRADTTEDPNPDNLAEMLVVEVTAGIPPFVPIDVLCDVMIAGLTEYRVSQEQTVTLDQPFRSKSSYEQIKSLVGPLVIPLVTQGIELAVPHGEETLKQNPLFRKFQLHQPSVAFTLAYAKEGDKYRLQYSRISQGRISALDTRGLPVSATTDLDIKGQSKSMVPIFETLGTRTLGYIVGRVNGWITGGILDRKWRDLTQRHQVELVQLLQNLADEDNPDEILFGELDAILERSDRGDRSSAEVIRQFRQNLGMLHRFEDKSYEMHEDFYREMFRQLKGIIKKAYQPFQWLPAEPVKARKPYSRFRRKRI